MSATTLLLAVTGGVFCGASLIGAVMIMLLWLQANQGKSSSTTAQPSQRPVAVLQQQPMPDPALMTIPPMRFPEAPIIPVPLPVMPDPSGVDRVWLDGIGGMVAGQRIMLGKPQVMIGRSGVCDVQMHDPKISRQHAMLRLQAGVYYLEDLRSTSGTYVNGRRVTTHQLRDRDQIRFGDSVLVFRQQ